MSANRSVCESLESRRLLSFSTYAIPNPPQHHGGVGSNQVDVVAGPNAAVWISNPAGARLLRVSNSGAVKQILLRNGADPTGLAAGPAGTMWFVDSSKGKIGRVARNGQVREFVIPRFHKQTYAADAITLGPDGNMWFTADYTDQADGYDSPYYGDFPIVGRITPSGKVTEFHLDEIHASFSSGFGPPISIVSFDGDLYTSSGGDILQINTAGQVTRFTGTNLGTVALLVHNGALGGVNFTLKLTNGVATVQNAFATSTVDHGNFFPSGSGTITPDGNTWFLSGGTLNGIGSETPAGVFNTVALPNSDSVVAIGAGTDGNLWMLSSDEAHIYKLSLNDAILPHTDDQPSVGTPVRYDNPLLIAGSTDPITLGTFVDTKSGYSAADFSATVSWAEEGVTIPASVASLGNGRFGITIVHPLQPGPNTASVTIHNVKTGEVETFKTSFLDYVQIPKTTALNISATGGTLFSGNVADVSQIDLQILRQYIALITWGDGTSTEGTFVPDGHGGAYVTGTHRYDHSGQYPTQVQAYWPIGTTAINDINATPTGTATATVAAGSIQGTGYIAGAIEGPVAGGSFTEVLGDFTPAPAVAADLSHYHAALTWRPSSPSGASVISQPLTLALNHRGGFSASLAVDETLSTELHGSTSEYAVTVTDDRISAPADNVVAIAHGVLDLAGGMSTAMPLTYDPASLGILAFPTEYAIYALPFQTLLPVPWGESTPHPLALQMTSHQSSTLEVGNLTNVDSNQQYPGGIPDYVMPKVDPATLHGYIDWGDGTNSAATFNTEVGGVVHVIGTHTYTAPGSYKVQAMVLQAPVKGPSQQSDPTVYPDILLPIVDSTVTVS